MNSNVSLDADSAAVPSPVSPGREIAAGLRDSLAALCALFVTLTLDAARTRKQVPSLLLAALSIGTALVVAPDASLFVGLVIFLVLLIVRFVMDRRRGVLNA